MPAPWKTLSKKTIYQNRWLKLEESQIITPTGKPGTYTIVETKPFVMVVAVKDGDVLMVEQHRFSLQRQTLEFPAGGINDGEQPLAAAKRELEEETGYVAEKWELLCEMDDAVGIARHKAIVFIAQSLSKAKRQLHDEDGIIGNKFMPMHELEKMIRSGAARDTKVVALLYRAKLWLTEA